MELDKYSNKNCKKWWINSREKDGNAKLVQSNGRVASIAGGLVDNLYGVRPVLHLDLANAFVQRGKKIDTSIKSVSWDLVELGTFDGKPIIWRVLDVTKDEVFLLSDQVLTDRAYYQENMTDNLFDEDSTIIWEWEDSAIREWLNDTFYQESFSELEKMRICTYNYVNQGYPWDNKIEPKIITDKITLLSLSDIVNVKYGFPTDNLCEHCGRTAEDQEGVTHDNWILRPYPFSSGRSCVDEDGIVHKNLIITASAGIRPTLHYDKVSFNLSKIGIYYADARHGKYYWNKLNEPIVTNKPDATEIPIASDQPRETKEPGATKKPEETEEPEVTKAPNITKTPSETSQPLTTKKPNDTFTPDQTTGNNDGDSSMHTQIPLSASSKKVAKNYPAKVNIKNKKRYSLSKKLIIRDNDGIRSVTINGKMIKIKRKKNCISFKLSKYKKKLKKRKWNRLVIIDQKGKQKIIKFKLK